FWRVLLPPPATGPGILARLHRASTGPAADGAISLRVERMVRNVVLLDVGQDLVLHPVGERVHLDDAAVVVVELDLADVRAGRPLIAPQASDPGVQVVEDASQRLD